MSYICNYINIHINMVIKTDNIFMKIFIQDKDIADSLLISVIIYLEYYKCDTYYFETLYSIN